MCAERLGFRHLDTGAMYRAITLKVTRTHTDIRDKHALARLLRTTTVGVRWHRGTMQVLLDGSDASEGIRAPDVSELVSEVSAIPAVRRKMVAEQRRVAAGQAVVCEGRDIGSVVFPDADLKIFLECDADERARRRHAELAGAGGNGAVREVKRALERRDAIDSGREADPLRAAPDATVIDSTRITVDEVVRLIAARVRQGG